MLRIDFQIYRDKLSSLPVTCSICDILWRFRFDPTYDSYYIRQIASINEFFVFLSPIHNSLGVHPNCLK